MPNLFVSLGIKRVPRGKERYLIYVSILIDVWGSKMEGLLAATLASPYKGCNVRDVLGSVRGNEKFMWCFERMGRNCAKWLRGSAVTGLTEL